ncbi:MAG: hydrogen peroxide-inducible genes activator [Candidatus Hinthialibacter antarcticus]|nr:hydrogen peroxide-inducible genes activator [Candidatus Hinthialibacter antarcticus]
MQGLSDSFKIVVDDRVFPHFEPSNALALFAMMNSAAPRLLGKAVSVVKYEAQVILMPTITQLQYILAVNQTKHFGRAAEDCCVSQPSLSAQIQKVEDELEVTIFDRSKKPILVTEKGKKVIEQSKRIVTEYKKLLEVNQNQDEISGDFQLGIIPTLASYVLPLFIEQFSKKYPKVQLTINEYKTQDIIRALHDDRLDAGLMATPLNDDHLIERVLFYEPFYLFVSQNHELSKKKQVTEKDLDTESIWLLEEGHCFREQVLRLCSNKNKCQVLHNINFASGNLEALVNLIRKGRGCTVLPHLATLQLQDREKETLLKPFHRHIPTREVSLVYSRSFLKQEIIDALEQEILHGLPKEISSKKKKSFEIIDI